MRQRTVGPSQYSVEPGFSAAASFDVCATANLTFGLRHGIRMTGIYNSRHFMTLADHEWNRSRRYGRPLSFLMIDIDFFKSINDRFGHEVGDQMIVHLTTLTRACKRDSDVLARIDGEEFALLLPETDLALAQLVAERLRRDVVENPLIAKSDRILTTISIGVAVCNVAMIGIADLMRAADQALYDAKGGGRNRVVCSTAAGSIPADNPSVSLVPVATE